MPGFVADDYTEAFAPPTFTMGGRTHVGVIVSADQWWEIAPRIDALRSEDTSRDDMTALIRDMSDLCFPRPWWQVWKPTVSTLLARLPWGAQLEAVASFTVAQAHAQNGRPMTERTNGTDSDA